MDGGDDHSERELDPDGEGRTTDVGSPTATPNPYGLINSRGPQHEGNGSVASPLLGPSLQRRQRQGPGRAVNGGDVSSLSEKRGKNDQETERDGGELRAEEKFDRESDSSTPRVVVELDEEMEVPVDELGDSHLDTAENYLSSRKKSG